MVTATIELEFYDADIKTSVKQFNDRATSILSKGIAEDGGQCGFRIVSIEYSEKDMEKISNEFTI
jgi:hypothetical protein